MNTKRHATSINVSPINQQTYSVPEFCAANRISRAFFYKLLKTGQGPSIMKVGRRTLISLESAIAWRKQFE